MNTLFVSKIYRKIGNYTTKQFNCNIFVNSQASSITKRQNIKTQSNYYFFTEINISLQYRLRHNIHGQYAWGKILVRQNRVQTHI